MPGALVLRQHGALVVAVERIVLPFVWVSHRRQIVGMHYLGWNAGEVIQGYAIGMKLGMKKSDLDSLVGIHPTSAEVFTTLQITNASGEDYQAAGC